MAAVVKSRLQFLGLTQKTASHGPSSYLLALPFLGPLFYNVLCILESVVEVSCLWLSIQPSLLRFWTTLSYACITEPQTNPWSQFLMKNQWGVLLSKLKPGPRSSNTPMLWVRRECGHRAQWKESSSRGMAASRVNKHFLGLWIVWRGYKVKRFLKLLVSFWVWTVNEGP